MAAIFTTVLMTTKRNRVISLIVGLFVSLYFLAGSIFSIFNDLNVDLTKSKQVVGRVDYADIRQISNFSIRYNTYSRVFYFRLNNSNQKFAVHNSYEGYDDLKEAIKVGDTIKVYYGAALLDDYNRHVFQIEKGDKVLINYKDYNDEASGKTGLGLFIGIILLAGTIMWYTRFNLLKFLTGLVGR